MADDFDYSSIKFELRASENIKNVADGTTYVAKGELAKDVYGKEVGAITLKLDGTYTVENLPMGTYTLKETVVPDGVILDETEHTVTFTQEDDEATHKTYKVVFEDGAEATEWVDSTKVQTAEGTILNKVTKTSITKTDVTGGKEVEGATLTITDENSEIVKDVNGEDLRWVSTKTPHKVKGLVAGKTYTLTEEISAEDYVKAESIQFTINKDGTVNQVTMKDKRVKFSKLDVNGEEVEGAKITVTDVTDKDNLKEVDSWTSTKDVHYIKGLEEGHSYILHEVAAPNGYVKATDVPFTVTGADENGIKVDQEVDMTDKRVIIKKTDGLGNEVEGATVQIKDEDGNIVDEWVSTKEPHAVNNLEEGKTYTWHEAGSVDGYYYAEDKTFTITDEKIDVDMEMVDAPIHYQIAKVDDSGKYVVGAKLKLTDITDAGNPKDVELPNGGVTTAEPFDLNKELIAEHTYKLEETDIVAGVYQAQEMEFTVTKYGTSDITTIQMLDPNTNIAVRKYDNHGNIVKGATLQIIETTTDENGNVVALTNEEGNPFVVYEFVTTTDPRGQDISEYVMGGSTYILRESKTPFGFETAEDKVFIVTGTTETAQIVTMVDVRKTYYVSAIKEDINDSSKTLKGAELALYTSSGEVAKDVDGKECKGTTDGKGNITWHVEYNGDGTEDTMSGYYVRETKAPKGYLLSDKNWEVTLSEDYDFANDNPVIVKVKDKPRPASALTGDNTPIVAYSVLGLGGLIALTVLLEKRRNA